MKHKKGFNIRSVSCFVSKFLHLTGVYIQIVYVTIERRFDDVCKGKGWFAKSKDGEVGYL